VLVIFRRDAKMRLAIGEGLRNAIPDSAASEILARIIAPRFRAGQHLLGLQEVARIIYQRILAAQRFKGEDCASRARVARSGLNVCAAI